MRRMTGIYFIVVAVVFYLLWLSEILPANFAGTVPKSIEEAGLFTNGVHVLDLSVVLPGIFITGYLVMKKNPMGMYLAPAVLAFFILMNLTIATLMFFLAYRGLAANPGVAAIMVFLALFSSYLLVQFMKGRKVAEVGRTGD